MIGCQVCRKEVSAEPPVKVCPHCGADMYYVPLGVMNFAGKVLDSLVKIIGLFMVVAFVLIMLLLIL